MFTKNEKTQDILAKTDFYLVAWDFISYRQKWPADILCVFQGTFLAVWGERPDTNRKDVLRDCPDKKGSRANRPAFTPIYALMRTLRIYQWRSCSGRQNLAALGTATGKNLAAVGSSHSHTETVNLGTMTAAGLIGTLHVGTPPQNHICSAAKRWPQQHKIPDHRWSYYDSITEKAIPVNHFL